MPHKYKPVTYYEAIGRDHIVRAIAREAEVSVSSLIRTAVMRFVQDIEEWDDAVHYLQAAHKPMPPAPAAKLIEFKNVAD